MKPNRPALLIRPKFVALDSSHLGAIARDKASADAGRQHRAQAFEAEFSEADAVMVLCWHHLQELFSHQNEDVAAQRLAYIQSLSLVAVIASAGEEGIIGTIVDLQSLEVAAAFRNPTADAVAVRDEASKKMIRLTSGADLVRPFLESWSALRQSFAESEQRSREVVAISKSDFTGNSDAKILDILKGKLRAPHDIQRQFQSMHGRLKANIRERGDKRISDAERSSRTFIEEVIQVGMGVIQPDNPGLRILQACGLDLSDIGPDTTVADVGDIAAYRKKLELINKNLGLPWPELIARVKEERLPSGIIYNAIRRHHPDTREWDGSELADRELACLAAYVDVIYVDKRTHEAFRQARQKLPTLTSLIGFVEKTGQYSSIPDEIAARFSTNAR
ncbi:hypothetical protein [Mesorhizobium sp. CA4]|uniref:hypothetical protein n=1 Tax=Mesorhizobium sp. CA4 TaxID=588499 RepID=UPI001CD0F0C3|nr:hypothetical protein [Mesorhizobium sp. CA4]MBZ9823208.1 hypothetical protein [Mesorhizobium sp. CA4]